MDMSSEKRWGGKLGKAERLPDLVTLIQRSCMMENIAKVLRTVRFVVVRVFLVWKKV